MRPPHDPRLVRCSISNFRTPSASRGLDKICFEVPDALLALGFGAVEVGAR